MLKPTQKTNQLGLTGQQFYGSSQAKKARRPSGANAPQPLANSGIPGTAGAEKPIGLQRPLVGMQSQPKPGKPLATNYYQMPTTPLSQPSAKPIDMGIQNRTDAEAAYKNLQVPAIGKGPSFNNSSGNPSDYLQKLYGGPTPTTEPPKKPELDRFTDLGVDPSDYHNLKSGNVGQAEWDDIKKKAIQTQMDRFYGISPERQAQLDADVARDRELGRKRAAEDAGNLAYAGAINDGYSTPTNRQTDYYGERRASLEAELKRQEVGGGLKYREASTGFGTREQGAQAAADFRNMGAADQARNQRIKDESERLYHSTRAERDARIAQQELPIEQGGLGLRNAQQAGTDVASLTGQYTAIARSGQAKGLKFLDFIQNKIDRGELGIGDDSVKIIANSYNHEFSDQDKDRAGMYQQQWGNPLNAARDAYGQRQAAQDEVRAAGMAQRQQIAAQQGADRTREAKLIAQGLTPAAARAAVAQQNATADYYNQQRLNNQDRLTAELLARQAELAQKDQEDARRYLDRESQRAYDAQNPKATGSGKAKQPNAADGSAGSSGATGSKGTGNKAKPPENPRVGEAVSSLTADKNFKPKDPGSFAQAGRHFAASGLDLDNQVAALSKTYGADFSDSSVAAGTLENIGKHADKTARESGKWSDTFSAAGKRAEAIINEHLDTIRALGHASGLTNEEIAAKIYPEPSIQMGAYDPFVAERRQMLIQSLLENPAGEE